MKIPKIEVQGQRRDSQRSIPWYLWAGCNMLILAKTLIRYTWDGWSIQIRKVGTIIVRTT